MINGALADALGDIYTAIGDLGEVVQDTPDDLRISLYAKRNDQQTSSVVADGGLDNASITKWNELRTKDQRQLDLANCNVHTDYTVLGNDTTNKADTTDHVFGVGAIKFNKADGLAGTVYAGVQNTFTSLNFSEIFETGAFVGLGCKLTSIADVKAIFVRIGTDSSNYNEWEWGVDDLVTGRWMALRQPTNQPISYVGDGWNQAAVTYIAFGVEFGDESDELTDIKFDNVHLVGGRVTDATTDNTITASINTPNINVHRMGGTPVDTNTGDAGVATQRVVLASDQPPVDISIDNKSIVGSGDPNIDSYNHSAINLTTGADQVLVSSSASKQIWVYGIGFTCSVAGTVSFQDEDNTAITGIMDFYANSGILNPPSGNFAMPIWKLATNKDLEVDIVTCDVDGWIDYAIVSV